MRFLDKLIGLGIIGYLIANLIGAWDSERSPAPSRRAPPPQRPQAAGPAEAGSEVREITRLEAALPDVGRGRVMDLEKNDRRRGATSSGTAWSLGDGVWATARHVAEDCSDISWREGSWREPRYVFRDPNVDLLAFKADRHAEPLALATTPPRPASSAVAVGYPKGKAAVARLTLIGAVRVRYGNGEPFRAYYWTIDAVPEPLADRNLSGISGGPVLDRDGRTISVAIFGNDRRGTLGTVALSDLTRDARPHAAKSTARAPDGREPEALGRDLLASRRVDMVYCRG